MSLLVGEEIKINPVNQVDLQLSDDDINKKYRDGEIRIVTEQAK